MAGGIARGEVRLCRFADPDKQRPVVVLTRNAAIPLLSNVTVAPITSTVRGVPTEVTLDESDGMKGLCVVNLHNVVTVPKSKLGGYVATLGTDRMEQLCAALRIATDCSPGPRPN